MAVSCILVMILTYITTMLSVLALWRSPLNASYAPEIGVDPRSAFLLATALLVVPYVAGGTVLGCFGLSDTRRVVTLGIITTMSERLLIVGVTMLILAAFPGSLASTLDWFLTPYIDLVTMIRTEALPYFTWAYVILGIPISLFVLLGVVKAVSTRRQVSLSITP